MLRKLLCLSLLACSMTFATELPTIVPLAVETPVASESGTCSCKMIIIDSNGDTAYEPVVHVEFGTGLFTSFKKFYGNKDGVITVTWDRDNWGSEVKCSMTIGTGLVTRWTKSTSVFTIRDGGSYRFDVRDVGY